MVDLKLGVMAGLASWMAALGDDGADDDLRTGAAANTPEVADSVSTIDRSQYFVIFLTSSFKVASLLTSIFRSSTTPSMLGRHSSNFLAADLTALRRVVDATVVESSLRSMVSKHFS
jgi:hypothetical protein